MITEIWTNPACADRGTCELFRELDALIDRRSADTQTEVLLQAIMRKAAMELAFETSRGRASAALATLSDQVRDGELITV